MAGEFNINSDFENDNLQNHLGDKQPKKSRKDDIFEWLEIFASVIVAVVLLFTFVIKVATIEGQSMEKTLFGGQKVIISDFLYTPKNGDIVVISRNSQNSYTEDLSVSNMPIIKRVIATEGQTVGIDFEKGVVYVDGKPLEENYTNTPTNLKYDIEYDVNNPVTVPKGHVFVLGDNRNNSLDSRSSQIGENGMVDTRYILGRALVRVFPLSELGVLK